MPALIRTLAFFLSICVVGGPLLVALFVAGVEPSRPIRVSWVAPFALGGLAAATGYLIVAAVPGLLARAAFELRLMVACLMAVPVAIATYLLSVTGSAEMVALCVAMLGGTAVLVTACVWPAWLAPKVWSGNEL